MTSEQQFTTLISENENLIYKVATVYTNSPEDCEDLFQEIVIQLWKAFGQFRGESKVGTWIYRIALNTAITGLRKRKRAIEWMSIGQSELNHPETINNGSKERIEFLYQCIKELNELDKAIILLYLEEKKYNEISEVIGLSETNIGTRLTRIKHHLKSKVRKP